MAVPLKPSSDHQIEEFVGDEDAFHDLFPVKVCADRGMLLCGCEYRVFDFISHDTQSPTDFAVNLDRYFEYILASQLFALVSQEWPLRLPKAVRVPKHLP